MKDSLKLSNQIDYNTLTNFILKLKKYNLKEVILMGSLSEPTLYYKFLEFIKLSLPDFEYNIIQDITPSLGLTIGYGLFD